MNIRILLFSLAMSWVDPGGGGGGTCPLFLQNYLKSLSNLDYIYHKIVSSYPRSALEYDLSVYS